MLGPLPDDFLQITGEPSAVGLPGGYHPAMFGGFHQPGGILNVTVVQVGNFYKCFVNTCHPHISWVINTGGEGLLPPHFFAK